MRSKRYVLSAATAIVLTAALVFVYWQFLYEKGEDYMRQPVEQSVEQISQEEEQSVLGKAEFEPKKALAQTDAVVFNDFDDRTTQGWLSRIGGEILSVSDEAARSGSYSLKVTGRAAAFHGPSTVVTDRMLANKTYEVSVWVRLLPGESPARMTLSAQTTEAGNRSFHNIIKGVGVNSDNWVQLFGLFQFERGIEELQIYIETVDGNHSFFIDDFTVKRIDSKPVQLDIPSLRDVFAENFTIGAAVEPIHLEGQNLEMLRKHFNLLVAGNHMKPASLQPAEGRFNFSEADSIMDFARANNMKMRFHTLVWHNQVPDWFFIDKEGKRMINETDPAKREANTALLLRRLETHIRMVVERYKNDVVYWEVVNEVIDPSRPDGMRNSQWYQITGKEFIKTAFRAAREAAGEDALLAINDYNTHQPQKRDFLYDLVTELKAQGIRVDIIGHQTHISIEYPSMNLISESIEKFAAAGFKNHITELDISVFRFGDGAGSFGPVPEHLLDRLALRYRDLFDEFIRLDEYIDDVTFWGIADNGTWLNFHPVPKRDAPLLFDERFQAKDAFWAVVDPDWEP